MQLHTCQVGLKELFNTNTSPCNYTLTISSNKRQCGPYGRSVKSEMSLQALRNHVPPSESGSQGVTGGERLTFTLVLFTEVYSLMQSEGYRLTRGEEQKNLFTRLVVLEFRESGATSHIF